jgi:hypothetical protein
VSGHPRPATADQTGESFAFEKHVSTLDEGKGYADVFYKLGFFGWEYKGKHKNLSAVYRPARALLGLLRFEHSHLLETVVVSQGVPGACHHVQRHAPDKG